MREVVLAEPGDFAEWRSAARSLLAGGVAPEHVSWRGGAEGASLFGDAVAAASAGAVSLPRELLLRVPGLGTRAVDRIVAVRRTGKLRLGDLAKLTASVKKVLPFIVTLDWRPGGLTDSADLRARFAPPAEQLALAL